MKIGIIGAGLSGLVCARKLVKQGHDVELFEKARGVSGRMSTRYAEDFEFDHGAQFMTVTHPDFQNFIDEMIKLNVVSQWSPKTGEFDEDGHFDLTEPTKKLYVAKPRMNSLARVLSDGLNIQVGVRIDQIVDMQGKWILQDLENNSHGPYDWVISSAPAPQSEVLFKNIYPNIEEVLNTSMKGAFTLMLGFKQPLETQFEMARPHNSCLNSIAINSSKPGRNKDVQSWVIQSGHDWSEIHMEDDKEEIMKIMIEEASSLTGLDLNSADHRDIHRWRYAISASPLGKPFMMDKSEKLALCGDWCATNKIEGAFMSGNQLAEEIISLSSGDISQNSISPDPSNRATSFAS